MKENPDWADLVFVDLTNIESPGPDSLMSMASSVCGPPHSSIVGDSKLLPLRKQENPMRIAGFAARGTIEASRKLQIILM